MKEQKLYYYDIESNTIIIEYPKFIKEDEKRENIHKFTESWDKERLIDDLLEEFDEEGIYDRSNIKTDETESVIYTIDEDYISIKDAKRRINELDEFLKKIQNILQNGQKIKSKDNLVKLANDEISFLVKHVEKMMKKNECLKLRIETLLKNTDNSILLDQVNHKLTFEIIE